MTPALELPERARASIAAAARWHLLAHLLTRPRPGFAAEASRLAQELREPELSRLAALADDDAQGVYLAVLGPGSTASPREAAYAGMEDPARVLAELAACYQAFAFEPRAEDPADHVSVEAGFVGYLCLKEAFAQARDDLPAAALVADTRGAFVGSHLRRLAQGLARRLDRCPEPLLSGAAAALAREVGPAGEPQEPLATAHGELLACDPAGADCAGCDGLADRPSGADDAGWGW